MNNAPKKKLFQVPHTYAILFFIIVLVALATYVVPAGEFERMKDEVSGKTIVVAGSYKTVEPDPVSFFEVFKAVPIGMEKGASIIFYIFIVGGAFGIIRATGAIEAGIGKAVGKLEGREKLLIPASMFLFSIGGFSFGMAEESIIFVPIGILLARAMGFDAITGTAMITLGAASGFIGGMLNPFTVGVAQSIAEVPLFSGLVFRTCVYVAILSFGIWYVMRYAYKVKKDPQQSVVADLELKAKTEGQLLKTEDVQKLNGRHLLVFLILIGGLSFNVFGVFKWGWFLQELAASFMIIGILAGLIGKLPINRIFDSFVEGARALTFGALVVGFARGITVVMEEGRIIDTVISSMADSLSNFSEMLTVLTMFGFQSVLNLFIPSGSGQAAATMPIMVPIADLVGISRQVVVLAFQYGDAISNSIIPTSGALMGYLAVGGIPYERWFRFIWRLIIGWSVIAALALVIAVLVGV